jgi:NADPH-dependent curcumin reductase CurA
MCGMIADYSADPSRRHGTRNLLELVEQRATARGFLVTDHADRFDEITEELATRVRDGRLRHKHDVVDGLENAPAALDRIFRGQNRGKVLVRVASDDAP